MCIRQRHRNKILRVIFEQILTIQG